MINARTYYPTDGSSSIQDNDLINVDRILTVHLEGKSYDPGPGARGFVYFPSDGRIVFNVVFEGAPTVRVTWIGGGGPVIVCTPVSGSITLPAGVTGQSYLYDTVLTGTPPFTLVVNDKPAWMTIAISGDHLQFTGTPDAAGSASVDIEITNCNGGGSQPLTGTVIVYDPPPPDPEEAAIRIEHNASPFTKITDVFNFPYTISSGSFPLSRGQQVLGVFPPFTGQIKVKVKSVAFTTHLVLRRNVAILQTISIGVIFTEQTFTFNSFSFADGDFIEIELNLP